MGSPNLERPFDRHIDHDELDALVPSCSQRGRKHRQLSAEALRKTMVHLEHCGDCRSRVSQYRQLVERSANLEGSEGVPSADCPTDVDWHEVAFGLWPEFKTEQLIAHAARCGHCGPLLRAAASVGENATPAEEEFLAQLKSPSCPARQPETKARASASSLPSSWRLLFQWKVFVPVGALLVVVGMWTTTRPAAAGPVTGAELAQFAVSTHAQHVRGGLTLDLQSDSEPRLREWLNAASPFHVVLPARDEGPSDRRPYRLEGARLVQLRGKTAAFIAYKMSTGPVSLLVTPDAVAVASGGVEVNFKKVSFHYRRVDAYKVVTWSVHGLTYALVSQEGNETQTSCMVCHSAMKVRDLSHTPTPLSTQTSFGEPVWQ